MPKMDGYKTKEKILRTAEKLFAQYGFDGTSIARIAREASVNKALIYYHFKDKNDLVISLFQQIVDELEQTVTTGQSGEKSGKPESPSHVETKMREEIRFLAKRKGILALLLMEALKGTDQDNFLFRCSEIVMEHEMKAHTVALGENKSLKHADKMDYFVHEFFTGFLPIAAFVALQEKWAEYFDVDKEEILQSFIRAFVKTHLHEHHPEIGG